MHEEPACDLAGFRGSGEFGWRHAGRAPALRAAIRGIGPASAIMTACLVLFRVDHWCLMPGNIGVRTAAASGRGRADTGSRASPRRWRGRRWLGVRRDVVFLTRQGQQAAEQHHNDHDHGDEDPKRSVAHGVSARSVKRKTLRPAERRNVPARHTLARRKRSANSERTGLLKFQPECGQA